MTEKLQLTLYNHNLNNLGDLVRPEKLSIQYLVCYGDQRN